MRGWARLGRRLVGLTNLTVEVGGGEWDGGEEDGAHGREMAHGVKEGGEGGRAVGLVAEGGARAGATEANCGMAWRGRDVRGGGRGGEGGGWERKKFRSEIGSRLRLDTAWGAAVKRLRRCDCTALDRAHDISRAGSGSGGDTALG